MSWHLFGGLLGLNGDLLTHGSLDDDVCRDWLDSKSIFGR